MDRPKLGGAGCTIPPQIQALKDVLTEAKTLKGKKTLALDFEGWVQLFESQNGTTEPYVATNFLAVLDWEDVINPYILAAKSIIPNICVTAVPQVSYWVNKTRSEPQKQIRLLPEVFQGKKYGGAPFDQIIPMYYDGSDPYTPTYPGVNVQKWDEDALDKSYK